MMIKIMRHSVYIFFSGLIFCAAPHISAQEIEQKSPIPRPQKIAQPQVSGYVATKDGVTLYFTIHGSGAPLILLQGGLGNTEYWGNQISVFSKKYRVISIDSRGQGRSSRNKTPYSYKLMASDVLTVMNALEIPKAAIVGWSDGGNIGINLAITNPDRLTAVFTYGANYHPSGVQEGEGNSPLMDAYIKIVEKDHKRLSTTPNDLNQLIEQIAAMWKDKPNFTPQQLGSIQIPVAIAAGQNEEVIRHDHTREFAKMIPNSTLIELKDAGHFAIFQNPDAFNRAVLEFLAQR